MKVSWIRLALVLVLAGGGCGDEDDEGVVTTSTPNDSVFWEDCGQTGNWQNVDNVLGFRWLPSQAWGGQPPCGGAYGCWSDCRDEWSMRYDGVITIPNRLAHEDVVLKFSTEAINDASDDTGVRIYARRSSSGEWIRVRDINGGLDDWHVWEVNLSAFANSSIELMCTAYTDGYNDTAEVFFTDFRMAIRR